MFSYRLAAVALALTILGVSAPAARAGLFMSNRSDWQGLARAERVIYVMATFDRAALIFTTDSPEIQRSKAALQDCLSGAGITSGDLVTMVDETYAGRADLWQSPPAAVLTLTLNSACRPQLDAATGGGRATPKP